MPRGLRELNLIIASVLRKNGSTGVHTHVRELIRFLEFQGFEPTLITPFSWGGALRYPVFGSRFVIAPVSTSHSVMWYRRWHEEFLFRALRENLSHLDHAVVYAQGPVEASAALRARRSPEQRVVMASHYFASQADEWLSKRQIERNGRAYDKIRSFEKRVLLEVDALVFVSSAAREALFAWLPEAGKVSSAVIPNFVSPSPDVERPMPMADLVTVGGLEVGKNHVYMLEVLASARRNGQVLTLDVYGNGPCGRMLTETAELLNVSGQVRFLGFRPDVRDQLPRYSAYVHTSVVESLPLAVIEAMAAGLPVVSGRVGGMDELISDGAEGRFWPLDDPDRASEILVGLLASGESVSMGTAAAARFRRQFQTDVVAPQLLRFLLGGLHTTAATARAVCNPSAGSSYLENDDRAATAAQSEEADHASGGGIPRRRQQPNSPPRPVGPAPTSLGAARGTR